MAGRAVSAEDAGEAGLHEITSGAFVVRSAGEIVAAAGYEVWPLGTAHLSVLTDPGHRGRGLARAVASAAVDDAVREGLVPQWRARPEASRRVARALGFREIGAQISIRLRDAPLCATPWALPPGGDRSKINLGNGRAAPAPENRRRGGSGSG